MVKLMLRWRVVDESWPPVGARVSLTLYGEPHTGRVQPHQVKYSGVPVTLDTGVTQVFLPEQLYPVVEGKVGAR